MIVQTVATKQLHVLACLLIAAFVELRQQELVERREWNVSRNDSHFVVTANALAPRDHTVVSFYVSEVKIGISALLMRSNCIILIMLK